MIELSDVAVPACLIVAVAFGAWALYIARIQSKISEQQIDFYLTARNSLSSSRIAWSFFSASVGAWVMIVPSQFSTEPVNGAGNLAIFDILQVGLVWLIMQYFQESQLL
jgi:hypothetical protein